MNVINFEFIGRKSIGGGSIQSPWTLPPKFFRGSRSAAPKSKARLWWGWCLLQAQGRKQGNVGFQCGLGSLLLGAGASQITVGLRLCILDQSGCRFL